ncbi:helix-turn-helix domain-containing protein [Lentilitoribacter sp. Alg239-R112]|uniref:helix-turn-helix domain-containing protein n=1 Tax=Lentilitoribacter sp. Alg239-R112 TaxID=2305987 RepID=UPI0013A7055D
MTQALTVQQDTKLASYRPSTSPEAIKQAQHYAEVRARLRARAKVKQIEYMESTSLQEEAPKPKEHLWVRQYRERLARKAALKAHEKRMRRERLEALEAADMENAIPLDRVTIKQIQDFVLLQDWNAPKASYKRGSGTFIDLTAKRRTKEFVIVRQAAMYICKKLTIRSFPEIGRKFGGRDHTTVLHAVSKIQTLIYKEQFLMNGELFSLERLEI